MTRSVSFKPLNSKDLKEEFKAFEDARLLIPIELKKWVKENRSKFTENRFLVIGYIGMFHGYLMERLFAVKFIGNKMHLCETGRRFYDRSHNLMAECPYYGMYRGYMPLYDYLATYQMCPGIEYLVKKGWSVLVPFWKQLNTKGRDVSTLARIPKMYEKALVDGTITLFQIRCLHNYPFRDVEQALDYLNYVSEIYYYYYPLNFQEKIYLWKKHDSHSGYANEYMDYIRMAKELNYPLDNSWYHFPSNYQKLQMLHDRAAEDMRIRQQRRMKEQLAKERDSFIKAVAPFSVYEWEHDGMIAVSAKVPDDLIREGQTLNHCVGSYVGRVSRQETMIFFIRHANEPEKPYVTLELRNKTITQVYGSHDTMPKQDAVSFVNAWQEHFGFKQAWKSERIAVPLA